MLWQNKIKLAIEEARRDEAKPKIRFATPESMWNDRKPEQRMERFAALGVPITYKIAMKSWDELPPKLRKVVDESKITEGEPDKLAVAAQTSLNGTIGKFVEFADYFDEAGEYGPKAKLAKIVKQLTKIHDEVNKIMATVPRNI